MTDKHILFNGETLQVPPDCTVQQLLQTLQLLGKRLAVELNGQIVPRSQFAHQCLQHNDRVEIVQAIGGG